MPALPEVAAIIDGGVVVNVAALSDEVDYTGWLAAMRDQHDDVRLVAAAGIGWEEYEPGKVRPVQPGPDCVWTGSEWDCPEPEPVDPS
jgi:hypothetical protein